MQLSPVMSLLLRDIYTATLLSLSIIKLFGIADIAINMITVIKKRI